MAFLFQTSITKPQAPATEETAPKKREMTPAEWQKYLNNAMTAAQNIDNKIKNGATFEVRGAWSVGKDNSNVLVTGVWVGAGKRNMLKQISENPYKYKLAPSIGVNFGISEMWIIMPLKLYQTFGLNLSPKIFEVGKGSAFVGGSPTNKMPDNTTQIDLNLGLGKFLNLSNKIVLNALVEGKFTYSTLVMNLVSDQPSFSEAASTAFGAVLKTRFEYNPGSKVSPYIKTDFAFLSKKDYVGGTNESKPMNLILGDLHENRYLELPKKKVFPSSIGAGVTLNLVRKPMNFNETTKLLEELNRNVKMPKVQLTAGAEINEYKKISGYIAVGYNF
ncbi:MAG: hypothetical protein NT051_00775 [Candidatus Micrarchaeota archaeon]|nr:hypothetical protein [Candidatus Micrarchaeota archaeon]